MPQGAIVPSRDLFDELQVGNMTERCYEVLHSKSLIQRMFLSARILFCQMMNLMRANTCLVVATHGNVIDFEMPDMKQW
jgi:hypothetical protein